MAAPPRYATNPTAKALMKCSAWLVSPSWPKETAVTDVLVTGAGGFIGGHMVAALRRSGVGAIRAVDKEPLDTWHQRFDGVENVTADLKDFSACL
jgi:tRNA A37 threonylcarbamoyladenosine dehydratase